MLEEPTKTISSTQATSSHNMTRRSSHLTLAPKRALFLTYIMLRKEQDINNFTYTKHYILI